jgi:hypothetical protein
MTTPDAERKLKRLEELWDGFEERVNWDGALGFSWSTDQREQLRLLVLFWALSALSEQVVVTEGGERVEILSQDEYEALTDRLGERVKLIRGLEDFRREAE